MLRRAVPGGIITMMDYLALLYLAVFPVITVTIGWTILSKGVLSSDDKLALRKVQRWRFATAFSLFAVAWLLLVSGGMMAYNSMAPIVERDTFAAVALLAAVVWLGCTAYWMALLHSAGDMLHLPDETARRAASSTLLWNLIFTIPFFAIAMPIHTEPLRILAGL
jgi:hypothetical protein